MKHFAAHVATLAGRRFYEQLMSALPDLQIEVPATGRRLELPLCGIYTFDADDRLAGERIYYDRGTVLRQLAAFNRSRLVTPAVSAAGV
jgi:hypothetical protein